MSLERLKTVYFLGSLINNVKGIFNKTNELVDAVNALETSTTPTYKVYRAIISQTGTSIPSIIEVQNTTGATISVEYADVGQYQFSFDTFTWNANKVIGYISSSYNGGKCVLSCSGESFTILTRNNSDVPTNSILNSCSLEVLFFD